MAKALLQLSSFLLQLEKLCTSTVHCVHCQWDLKEMLLILAKPCFY